MPKAVLFKSEMRFDSFKKKLKEYGIDYVILDFEDHDWLEFDYGNIDFIIHYPLFKYSSNHPLALQEVYDNITFLSDAYPHLRFYPDPSIIKYYNDKYRQFLFLSTKKYPIPRTIPLFSPKSIELAEKELGYPMVIKNRYGAGGDSVFRVTNRKELTRYFNLSTMKLFNWQSLRYFFEMLNKRLFYYELIKENKAHYPFLSPPVIAQEFVKIDRDLKTVVGKNKVIEAHWRLPADEKMWKMNIDGGGIGIWSRVPDEAIDLSVRLAIELNATWLNIDMIMANGHFLITEFSPVWHHYAYKEKPSFVYKDDYNIDLPLEISLDLERIILESLIEDLRQNRSPGE